MCSLALVRSLARHKHFAKTHYRTLIGRKSWENRSFIGVAIERERVCVFACARARIFSRSSRFVCWSKRSCTSSTTIAGKKFEQTGEEWAEKKASRHTTAHTNQSGETRQQLFSCCNLHKYAERVNLDLIDALVFIFPRTKCVPGNALFFFLSFCVWQRFAWQHIDATT